MKKKSAPTVYSTDHGRMCPDCGKPSSACSCGRKKSGPVGDGMHTRDEWVDLDSLARRTVLLADLLASLRRPTQDADLGGRRGA